MTKDEQLKMLRSVIERAVAGLSKGACLTCGAEPGCNIDCPGCLWVADAEQALSATADQGTCEGCEEWQWQMHKLLPEHHFNANPPDTLSPNQLPTLVEMAAEKAASSMRERAATVADTEAARYRINHQGHSESVCLEVAATIRSLPLVEGEVPEPKPTTAPVPVEVLRQVVKVLSSKCPRHERPLLPDGSAYKTIKGAEHFNGSAQWPCGLTVDEAATLSSLRQYVGGEG